MDMKEFVAKLNCGKLCSWSYTDWIFSNRFGQQGQERKPGQIIETQPPQNIVLVTILANLHTKI